MPTRILRLAFPALLASATLGCVVSSALDTLRDAPTGSVTLSSAELGDHVLTPAACRSGERHLFLGADFPDASGLTARLILEPSGAASVRFFAADRPLEEGVTFTRRDCARFELSLERTDWRINEIYDLRIRLELDCRAAKASAQGLLAADHCH